MAYTRVCVYVYIDAAISGFIGRGLARRKRKEGRNEKASCGVGRVGGRLNDDRAWLPPTLRVDRKKYPGDSARARSLGLFNREASRVRCHCAEVGYYFLGSTTASQ